MSDHLLEMLDDGKYYEALRGRSCITQINGRFTVALPANIQDLLLPLDPSPSFDMLELPVEGVESKQFGKCS